jgi:hypothetical protein
LSYKVPLPETEIQIRFSVTGSDHTVNTVGFTTAKLDGLSASKGFPVILANPVKKR